MFKTSGNQRKLNKNSNDKEQEGRRSKLIAPGRRGYNKERITQI